MYIFMKLSTCSVVASNNIYVTLIAFDMLIAPIIHCEDTIHIS